MDARTVHVGPGISTHYLEGGPRDAPVVVLVHDGAFGGDAEVTWGPLLEPLSRRYHVYAPDLLGFGKTSKVYDFQQDHRRQRVQHLAHWLEAIGVREASFIGSSMGGGLVLLAAAQRAWPIKKAVSIAGTAGAFQVRERFQELQSYDLTEADMRRIVELLIARRDAFTDQLVRKRYENSLVPGHWENLSAARLRSPIARQSATNWLEEYLAAFARIEVPVLLIAGGDDLLMEPGWEQRLAERIPSCRTHVIPGARHQPQLDRPEQTLEVLVSFLES